MKLRPVLLLLALLATALWVWVDSRQADSTAPDIAQSVVPAARTAQRTALATEPTQEPTQEPPQPEATLPPPRADLFRRIPSPATAIPASAGAEERLPRWIGLDRSSDTPAPLLEWEGRAHAARPGQSLGPWRVLHSAPTMVRLRHRSTGAEQIVRPNPPTNTPVSGLAPGTE